MTDTLSVGNVFPDVEAAIRATKEYSEDFTVETKGGKTLVMKCKHYRKRKYEGLENALKSSMITLFFSINNLTLWLAPKVVYYFHYFDAQSCLIVA